MDWKSYLKKNGIKVTKARIALLNILEKVSKGISAENLYEECKNQGVNINLSTIYRFLELFEERKLINKVSLGEGPFIYSLNKNKHNHTVECDVCHKEIAFPCPIQHIEELLKAQVGFTLKEHKLEMKGVCEDCKE